MRAAVDKLWPEIQWIQDSKLREQVAETWVKALERSPLKPDDLNSIPFTLLVPHCPVAFMEHKRCVVHIARDRQGGSHPQCCRRSRERRQSPHLRHDAHLGRREIHQPGRGFDHANGERNTGEALRNHVGHAGLRFNCRNMVHSCS